LRLTVVYAPTLRLEPLGDVTVLVGENKTVSVRVVRRNCNGPIELRLENLPGGVQQRSGAILDGANSGELKLAVLGLWPASNRLVTLVAATGEVRTETKFRLTIRPSREQEPPKEINNSIGMKLIRIPDGKFMMGSADDDRDAELDEKPRHEVKIDRP